MFQEHQIYVIGVPNACNDTPLKSFNSGKKRAYTAIILLFILLSGVTSETAVTSLNLSTGRFQKLSLKASGYPVHSSAISGFEPHPQQPYKDILLKRRAIYFRAAGSAMALSPIHAVRGSSIRVGMVWNVSAASEAIHQQYAVLYCRRTHSKL
jgi:hypothetical protein